MPDPEAFWRRKKRSLERAWRAFRRDAPQGATEIAALLEAVAAPARAEGDGRMARRARRIARRCARAGAVESRRRLLSRIRRLGLISSEAADVLDARWEESSRDRVRSALDLARGRSVRKLLRAVSRRARAGERRLVKDLERAHRRSLRRIPVLAAEADDRALSRYRKRTGQARRVALALAQARSPRAAPPGPREGRDGDALDRWHDLRSFWRLLAREREEAERRGAVLLAYELDRLIGALDGAIEKTRRDALAQAATRSNVVFLRRKSA